ncbi:unnamed protein product [Cunninghamella blakesleeana]
MKILLVFIFTFIALCSAYDVHCGTMFYPHQCWRYCEQGTKKWCWIRPDTNCKTDVDCYYQGDLKYIISDYAPCSSRCG